MKVFYHSDQINSLNEVLELISSQTNQENDGNGKKTCVTYEMNKTKKIIKKYDSISVHKKSRTKFTIQGKIQIGHDIITKPLLITLENEILQFIKDEIQT